MFKIFEFGKFAYSRYMKLIYRYTFQTIKRMEKGVVVSCDPKLFLVYNIQWTC